MSKRRGNGEGSIYRKSNGRWCASLTVGYDENGKRRRRYIYGRTKTEVAEKLARTKVDALNGMLAEPTNQALSAYLDQWLENCHRPNIRESTYICYSSVIRNHINPHIGGVRLSKLRPTHVQGLHSALQRNSVSPRMRQIVHDVLSRALKQAVRMGTIPVNPCNAVDRPRVPRREMTALDAGQVKKLFETARGDPLEGLYVTAIGTGARLGELLGLKWADIDFESKTISIQRTLRDLNGRLEAGEPKTARSRRRIDLPDFVVTALKSHRLRSPAQPHPTAWVFSDAKGGPLRKSNFTRRSFRPLLKKAGLPPIRFHDLRHTAASLLFAQGVHPKVVQERLGHATIAITLDTYSHVIPTMQKEAATQLDALLSARGE